MCSLLLKRGAVIISTAAVAFFWLGCDNPTESENVQAPTIASEPNDITANVGGTTTFCVTASGSNLNYQWQKNGTNISGAASSCYTISVVTIDENSTQYRCIVANTGGSDTSKAARLLVTYADSEFSYLNIVNISMEDTKIDSLNAWYNNIHIPLLMQYQGLKATYRYKFQDESRKDYFTFFMYPSKAAIDSMATSTYFKQALADMNSRWVNGEYTVGLSGNYEKIKSWVKLDFKGNLQAVSMLIESMPAAREAAINQWYNETHIPLIMKYSGVKKTVRYMRSTAASTDVNPSQLPKYITVYYYGTKEEQVNQESSVEWAAVQANMNTETIDDQLTTSAVIKIENVKTVIK